MKKRTLGSLIAAVALLTACSGGGLTGTQMDSEKAARFVNEKVAKNIDRDNWKIFEINWSEQEELENTLGFILVSMVNSTGDCYSQPFIGQIGWGAGELSPEHWYQHLDFAQVKGLDPTAIDPAEYLRQIEAAKAMIPEGYSFKSVKEYTLQETLPSRTELENGTGTYPQTTETSFTLCITEDGNETVSSAGNTSIVYYEVGFHVLPDGTVEMDA